MLQRLQVATLAALWVQVGCRLQFGSTADVCCAIACTTSRGNPNVEAGTIPEARIGVSLADIPAPRETFSEFP
jgi:hypothetical protein